MGQRGPRQLWISPAELSTTPETVLELLDMPGSGSASFGRKTT
jgi:hypothetical protein